MEQKYKVLYAISLEDATPRKPGVKVARGTHFQEAQIQHTSERPPLQHVIDWIDKIAPRIKSALNEMLSNPGTSTLHLHARFPLRTTQHGHYFHESISDIPVDGMEVDRLKARVIEIYDKA